MFLKGLKKRSKPKVKVGCETSLYINTASWRLMLSDSWITFKSLNKRLECSAKLKKVIILIAFFCNLNKGCKVD